MWMNQPSSHQEHLSSELRLQGAALVVVYASPVRKQRKEIGWEIEIESSPNTIVLSTRYSFLQAVKLLFRHRRSVHVINGIWAEPVFFIVLSFALLLNVYCVIYSEAPASTFALDLVSRLKHVVQRLIVRFVARRAIGLLAISWLAERAFVSLGFPQSKIYRFGYFERMPRSEVTERVVTDGEEITYVGRLVKGKGIELLIKAAEPLLREDPGLRLRIVGGGTLEPDLRRLVHDAGLDHQVVFCGVVPSHSVSALLESASILVLPSEMDGWGMVVNQALQAGTPVIVSNSCGAGELVANGNNGYVFRTGDAESLTQCMRAIIHQPDSQRMRLKALETGRAASAECAAPYLLQCLEHMLGFRPDRPVPEWILNLEPELAQFESEELLQEPPLVH